MAGTRRWLSANRISGNKSELLRWHRNVRMGLGFKAVIGCRLVLTTA
ncbi:hypothetical protein SynRS9909_01053 [Synechococcus sp. RS9909]|nr:hypothetical protein SynRS9909_01053 [Synechococcus sp. RS9909]